MLGLVFAGYLGGGLTIVLLWPLGEWVALLCAPLGGSLATLLAAACVLQSADGSNELVPQEPEGAALVSSPAHDADLHDPPPPGPCRRRQADPSLPDNGPT